MQRHLLNDLFVCRTAPVYTVQVVTVAEPYLILIEYMKYGDLRAVLKTSRSCKVQVHLHEQLHMATQV